MLLDEDKIPDIIRKFDDVITKLGTYKPDVKKLEFDYLNESAQLRLKIQLNNTTAQDIEIPHADAYSIAEVFNGDADNVNLFPTLQNGNWVIKSNNIPSTDKLILILKGKISEDDAKNLVKISVPEDPTKNDETDEYWVHSAIRNMMLFENIYRELNIENVLSSIKVSVERTFASSAPREVIDFLQARAKLEQAFNQRDRTKLFREWGIFRDAKRKVGKLQSYQIFQLIQGLLTPNKFELFLSINPPFRIYNVTTSNVGLPESVKVGVLTELNKKLPAAHGSLVFKKKEFSIDVKNKFEEIMSGKEETKPKK